MHFVKSWRKNDPMTKADDVSNEHIFNHRAHDFSNMLKIIWMKIFIDGHLYNAAAFEFESSWCWLRLYSLPINIIIVLKIMAAHKLVYRFGAKIVPISGIDHVNNGNCYGWWWQRRPHTLHKPLIAISHIIDQIMILHFIVSSRVRKLCYS